MNTQLKNKIKAGIIMFIVDFIATIVTINLLGFSFEFTKQSIGIILVVNLLTTIILSKFSLIEDGKH